MGEAMAESIEAVLNELQRYRAEESARQSSLLAEMQRCRAEDSARYEGLSAELQRLSESNLDVGMRLVRFEAELANVKRTAGPGDAMKQQSLLQQQQLMKAQLDQHEFTISSWTTELQNVASRCESRSAELHQNLQEQAAKWREGFANKLQGQLLELRKEITAQLSAHEIAVVEHQHRECAKRDAELQELQDAAQRLAKTAIERAHGPCNGDVSAKLGHLQDAIADLQLQGIQRRGAASQRPVEPRVKNAMSSCSSVSEDVYTDATSTPDVKTKPPPVLSISNKCDQPTLLTRPNAQFLETASSKTLAPRQSRCEEWLSPWVDDLTLIETLAEKECPEEAACAALFSRKSNKVQETHGEVRQSTARTSPVYDDSCTPPIAASPGCQWQLDGVLPPPRLAAESAEG